MTASTTRPQGDDGQLKLANQYLKTLVTIEEAGVLMSVADCAALRSGTVHVITAWNPGDARPNRTDNDEANEKLRAALVARGLTPHRAVGSDPDSGHFEESWAVVGLSDSDARSIGAAFGQVAVFRLSAGIQTVLACTEDWELSRPL